MSFNVDKRTRVRIVKNIKVGEYFYVTNEADCAKSKMDNLDIPKLEVIAKCTSCTYWGGEDGFEAEMSDVQMITGSEYSASWKVENEQINNTYEFYRLIPEKYPEIFL